MESVLKSDIFFFITTFAVIVLTVGIVIALVYVIRILRDVREVSEVVKTESKRISGDLSAARISLKELLPAGLRRVFGARSSKRSRTIKR